MKPLRALFGAGGMALLLAFSPEARAAETALETIEFRVQIEPVFHVKSDSKGAGNVRLGPVTPGGRQALDTARIIVSTNRGRPYRILQYLGQEFMSERGFPLKESVRFQVSNGINGGQSEAPSPRPLTSERTVIFSNPRGTSDQFTISYFGSTDGVIPAGRYRAPIVIEEELL